MMLSFGEVVLIRMHFHQASGSKIRRPWSFSIQTTTTLLRRRSHRNLRRSPYDIALADWQAAGLNVASHPNSHADRAIEGDIVRHIGVLSGSDREAMGAILCRSFCSK